MAPVIPANYKYPKVLPAAAVDAFRRLEVGGVFAPDTKAIFKAVDYPDDPVGPRAESLTPAQRAAVEILTELDIEVSGMDTDTVMPRSRADRRSWLGLDPPQPLDKLYTFTLEGKKRTEPGWRALKLLREAEPFVDAASEDDGEDVVEAWLATVPRAERLAMWGQILLSWPEVWGLQDDDFWGSEDEIDAELGKSWAPAYADALCAAIASGKPRAYEMPMEPLLGLFLAKIPIEPRWDVLLPFNKYTLDILETLPAARREPALVRALKENVRHPASRLSRAIELLPKAPYPGVAEVAIECITLATGSPRQHLARLAKAAEGHPKVLAVIAAAQGKRPPAIKLQTLSLRDRSEETSFSEDEQSQLIVCGQKYFGKKKPLPTLLSDDADSEESLRHGLTLREVADAKGAHVYDLWEYMGDSGCLFRAGTTKVVAEIVQGSAQCDDAALSDALESVMRQKAPKAVAKKTVAKKKPAAKAAKKVAAKKTAAKKAVKKSPARR